jgi:hypothetical protein
MRKCIQGVIKGSPELCLVWIQMASSLYKNKLRGFQKPLLMLSLGLFGFHLYFTSLKLEIFLSAS